MASETKFHIVLPNAFKREHERVLTIYLSDDRSLDTTERQMLYATIDLLNQAEVRFETHSSTFRQIYDTYIDQSFADRYFEKLLTLTDVSAQSPGVAAEFAKQIAPMLMQADLLVKDVPQSYLLFAYCVYWWQSFARGYAFEVEIMRDLESSKIEFAMHDLRQPGERYSQADLIVLDLMGDIKTSTYFLQMQPTGPLINDFYITRLSDIGRVRTLVVFQKPHAWQRIGGAETIQGNLTNVLSLLPKPVQLEQSGLTLIVVEYENWKMLVQSVQTEEGK